MTITKPLTDLLQSGVDLQFADWGAINEAAKTVVESLEQANTTPFEWEVALAEVSYSTEEADESGDYKEKWEFILPMFQKGKQLAKQKEAAGLKRSASGDDPNPGRTKQARNAVNTNLREPAQSFDKLKQAVDISADDHEFEAEDFKISQTMIYWFTQARLLREKKDQEYLDRIVQDLQAICDDKASGGLRGISYGTDLKKLRVIPREAKMNYCIRKTDGVPTGRVSKRDLHKEYMEYVEAKKAAAKAPKLEAKARRPPTNPKNAPNAKSNGATGSNTADGGEQKDKEETSEGLPCPLLDQLVKIHSNWCGQNPFADLSGLDAEEKMAAEFFGKQWENFALEVELQLRQVQIHYRTVSSLLRNSDIERYHRIREGQDEFPIGDKDLDSAVKVQMSQENCPEPTDWAFPGPRGMERIPKSVADPLFRAEVEKRKPLLQTPGTDGEIRSRKDGERSGFKTQFGL